MFSFNIAPVVKNGLASLLGLDDYHHSDLETKLLP
jgi:hypothetical protein